MDDIDMANNRIEIETDNSIKAMRIAASQIPKGNAGECNHCGEYFSRIVHGACARCRDKYENDN